jgi:hypothetical protein
LVLLATLVLDELPKVAIVDPVGDRNHLFVEALRLPRLVASDQEDRRPLGVEGEEDPHRLGYPQLLHIGMPGALDGVGEWPACARAKLVELAGPLGSPTRTRSITSTL